MFYCLPAHENHSSSTPRLPVVCGYVLLGSGHGFSQGCFRENIYGMMGQFTGEDPWLEVKAGLTSDKV